MLCSRSGDLVPPLCETRTQPVSSAAATASPGPAEAAASEGCCATSQSPPAAGTAAATTPRMAIGEVATCLSVELLHVYGRSAVMIASIQIVLGTVRQPWDAVGRFGAGWQKLHAAYEALPLHSGSRHALRRDNCVSSRTFPNIQVTCSTICVTIRLSNDHAYPILEYLGDSKH